jgi:hypothetical protein
LQPAKVVIAIEGTWHYATGITRHFAMLRGADRLGFELGANPRPQRQFAVTLSFRLDRQSW